MAQTKEQQKAYYQRNRLIKLEKARQYREQNKEKIKEYHLTNKDRLNQYSKEYYIKNKEEILPKKRIKQKERWRNLTPEQLQKNHKYHVQYREKNLDKLQKKAREWYRTVNGCYSYLRSRALQRKKNFTITKEEFKEWFIQQPNYCHYCKREFNSNRIHLTKSIDRMDNNKGYEINNIVRCCFVCNVVKNDYFSYNQMLEIGEFIKQLEKR